MKVLQLCHKPPYPCKHGGCLAMHTITQGLLDEGVDVKLITLYTQKHDLDLDTLSDEYKKATDIEGVFVDTTVSWVDAFSSLVTQDSYNVSRFFTPDFDIRLTRLLRRHKFDIVHIESLFMTPYIGTIRRYSKAKIVLRSHNHEHAIWNNVAEGTTRKLKKAYLRYLSRTLKVYEEDQLTAVDGLISISKDDYDKYEYLGYDTPLINLPFGIDLDAYTPSPPPKPLTLFHIGAMDWTPNLEGVNWFLEEIWPSVHKRFPELQVHLAGRKFPPHFAQKNHPNVFITGEVADAKEFMSSQGVMIVPLLSAGGIRVKIIEGLALGRPIISTTKGAQGIDYKNGKNIFVCDTPAAFIEAIEKLQSQTTYNELADNGRALVQQEYDNKKLVKTLISFYQSLLGS